jgi:16S rRNA A1518/A1519 N6-dimethyltransferase RsmA/KsgA/DIM1 with predicted DNA glycosylase/AP lyase activity
MHKPRSDYTVADQMRMTRAKNYFAWHSRLAARELGQRVVEIGYGLGNFTGMLLERELVIALDIEPECVAQLLRRYPDRNNLRAIAADVNDAGFARLAAERMDSCVALNVLEHIEDDAAH